MPGLGAPVRGEQVAPRGGSEPGGDQPGGGGDEAVEHDGDAAGRSRQDDADEPRDLEAADRREDAERRRPASGRLTASARRTASTFPTQTSSATPVPRPVTIAGSAPVSAAVRALAAVVLPIPISPVPTQSGAAASTSAAPSAIARTASSRVIAGPFVMLRVPGAMRRSTMPAWPASGAATPRSATTTRAPTWRARTFTAGAAPREVLDHLRGHGLGIGAHALGRDAVVAGEREDHRRLDPRQGIPGDHDHPDGELLQPPEAPPRLRQAVEPVTGRLGQPLVRHDDGGDEAIEGDHRTGRLRETREHRRASPRAGSRRPSAPPRQRRAPRPG